MSKLKKTSINIRGTPVAVLSDAAGEFFISDWSRNQNTVEFLGVWESVHSPAFNSGGFAGIKSQLGLPALEVCPAHRCFRSTVSR